MEAWGDFYPSFGEGQDMSRAYVDQVIEAAGITVGIQEDAVNEAITRCREQHHRQDHVVIARGSHPKPGVPAHLKLRKRFYEKHQPSRDISILKVDYKKESPFIIVKEGERLGRMVPEVPGEKGQTVTGEELPVDTQEMVPFQPGENVVEKEGRFFAACPGHFELKDGKFWIHKVLELEGNVDYHTGHISFPGDVVIPGVIKDGFRVAAAGDVFCKDTLDASEVLARGNLIVDQGIIGRGAEDGQAGLVRVAGRVETQFIENCRVECKGGLNVVSGIINSKILALGKLEMGEKGQILGGELVIEKGLSCTSIGRPSSPPAVIKCGYSFVEHRRLESMKQRQEVLRKKIEKMKRLIEYRSGRDVVEMKNRMEKALEDLGRQMAEIMERLYAKEKIEIVAEGAVEAGTVIEICHVSYMVKSTQKNVRYFLNKNSGNVEWEPLMDKGEAAEPRGASE